MLNPRQQDRKHSERRELVSGGDSMQDSWRVMVEGDHCAASPGVKGFSKQLR
jgi:hypothetical protein